MTCTVLVAAGKLLALCTLSVEDLLLSGVDALSGRRIRAKLLTSLSLPRTFASDAMIRYGSFLLRSESGCRLTLLHVVHAWLSNPHAD